MFANNGNKLPQPLLPALLPFALPVSVCESLVRLLFSALLVALFPLSLLMTAKLEFTLAVVSVFELLSDAADKSGLIFKLELFLVQELVLVVAVVETVL